MNAETLSLIGFFVGMMLGGGLVIAGFWVASKR